MARLPSSKPPLPNWRTMIRRLGHVTKEEAKTRDGGDVAQMAMAVRISRELAARTFVAAYISSGFSIHKAYCALREHASQRQMRRMAWRWLADRRVQQLLSDYDRARERQAKLDLMYMLEETLADASASPMDFVKYDDQGRPYYDVDPRHYTAEQRRRIKQIKIFGGEVVEIRTPDPIAARRQALEIMRLMQGEHQGSGSSRVVARLGKMLKEGRSNQADALRGLVKPRTQTPALQAAIDKYRAARRASKANVIDAVYAEGDRGQG